MVYVQREVPMEVTQDRPMNVFELTQALVEIESVTGNELQIGRFLFDHLAKLAAATGGQVERMEVAANRFNVFTSWGQPVVTLSTHMDTVPPFFPFRDDSEHIRGRGSCDAKGIVASMICACEKLRAEGVTNFGTLFVVGEERDGAGAQAAARSPRGSRYLINGEPTENKLALASKGALRVEIVSRGTLAHSAYPELGESAIEKLLDVLEAIRRIRFPSDGLLGRCTLNIGTIAGGRAPNVVADSARAEILVRLVGDAEPVRAAIASAADGKAEVREILHTPPVHFERLDGFATTVVSFTTDVPILGAGWGKPFLIGPGTIHVAHTADERVPKNELADAVVIYGEMVGRLLTT
jgi:acetylornithine deacetylase